MNIIFAGTPEIAAHCLTSLLQTHHQISAVYTQPDRPAGRGKKLLASPVKSIALAHQIPVYQPEKLTALDIAADIMVVVAYGLILPEKVLNAPRFGCINVHTSLLPKYRGASPVQQAILQGETLTGVSIMQLNKGCDTGPVLLQKTCEIAPHDTSASLLDKLTLLGSQALIECLDQIEKGIAIATPQNASQASYAHKIEKQHGNIDWRQSAAKIDCAIRAYQPWPIAYTYLGEHRISILQAHVIDKTMLEQPGTIVWVNKNGLLVATGKGALNIEIVQLPGKKPMPVSALLNGHPDFFKAGMVFHHEP